MKKLVLTILLVRISLSLFSQAINHSIPLPYKESPVSASLEANFRTASCGDDSLLYPYIKEVYLPSASSTFYLDLMTGNQSAWSQTYELGGTPIIKAIQFWGRVYDRSDPSQTILVKAYLYSVDGANMPLAKLDSATVLVNTLEALYTAEFSSPVPVSADFAVVIRNPSSTDTLGMMINNADAGTYGEGLAWRKSTGAWQTAAAFWGKDSEPIIAPIVSYDVNADYTTMPGTTVMAGTTINHSNISSPSDVIEHRMYNFHALGSYWGATLADSTYAWDPGDGGGMDWNKHHSYVYNTPGTYYVTLTCMTGFYKQCADFLTTTITVTGIPTGIAAESDENIILYPNPSAGGLIVEGCPKGENCVEVFDRSGRSVYAKNYSSDEVVLDLSHCAPGHYTIRIMNSDKLFTRDITLSK